MSLIYDNFTLKIIARKFHPHSQIMVILRDDIYYDRARIKKIQFD